MDKAIFPGRTNPEGHPGVAAGRGWVEAVGAEGARNGSFFCMAVFFWPKKKEVFKNRVLWVNFGVEQIFVLAFSECGS